MRFAPVFIAFFLFLSPALALAENASANESSAPPSVPQGQGPVSVKAVLANGSSYMGMPVTIIASSGSAATTYRLITGREGILLLQLGDGNYQLSATLDDMTTPGVDYASSAGLSVPSERNLTLIFYPAGSVAASVLEQGRIVPGADFHVSCSSDWFDYSAINGASQRATEAGGFLFRALPTGTCVISASTQTSAGSAQVVVEQGKLQNAQIEMKPKALALPDAALLLAALVLVAGLAYIGFMKMKQAPHQGGTGREDARQNARPKAKKEGDAQPVAHHARQGQFDAGSEKARAVLSTLSEREAEIVRFLMSSGGKSKRSTMQQKLLIPKTSLLRNLRALERKNIVKLVPFGRNMVAELHRELFE